MALTNKQEAFCKAIALEGMNQSDAYRSAYPTSLKWADKTVNEMASKLSKNTKVLPRIKELKDKIETKVIEASAKTKIDIINELETIKDNDAESKIKIDCLKEQGKLLGYYVEQKKDLNPSEFKEWLKGTK